MFSKPSKLLSLVIAGVSGAALFASTAKALEVKDVSNTQTIIENNGTRIADVTFSYGDWFVTCNLGATSGSSSDRHKTRQAAVQAALSRCKSR